MENANLVESGHYQNHSEANGEEVDFDPLLQWHQTGLHNHQKQTQSLVQETGSTPEDYWTTHAEPTQEDGKEVVLPFMDEQQGEGNHSFFA